MRLNAALLSLFSLTACGGGSSETREPASTDADRVLSQGAPRGVVLVDEYAGKYLLDAWFTRVPEFATSERVLWQEGTERCAVMDSSSLSSAAVSRTNPTVAVGTLWQQTLSAGESLEVRDRGGVVVSMPAQRFGKAVMYTTDERWLDEPLPEDAYLSIPGTADFPAFESVSVRPLTPLLVTAPENGSVLHAGDAVEWQASAASDDTIELTLSAAVAADTDPDNIRCTLEDNGRFALPEAVWEAVADNTQGINVSLLRTRSTVHEVADANLTVTQLSRP